ncbi:MAG: hypothetical protein ABSH20_05620 [Tepidisphaeraceae bacterium]|jgi:hypothetical protein
MTAASQPPGPHDPAGIPANARDVRAEFERLAHKTPRDRKAGRAFIEARIEMIRGDSRLTPANKGRLIAELRRRI